MNQTTNHAAASRSLPGRINSTMKYLALALIMTLLAGLLPVSAQQQPTFLTNGLVAYYPFNGNANDESGNGNNGVVYNVILTTNRFGVNNSAFRFNQNLLSAVQVFNPKIPFGTNARTVSLWCNIDPVDASIWRGQWLLGYGPDLTAQAFGMAVNSAEQFVVWSGLASSGSFEAHSVDMFNGNWHMITVSFASNNVSGYLDGKKFSWTVFPFPGTVFITAPSDLFIGWWSGKYYDGMIDDVRIYDRALSGEEIAALYNFESTPTVSTIQEIAMVPRLTIRGKVGSQYWIMSGSEVNYGLSWSIVTNITLTSDPFIFYDETATSADRFYQAFPEETAPIYAPERFVWIKPGTFTMGSPASEKDRVVDEGPQTVVTITKGFWMAKYETTQAEYQAVMGSNPSSFTGDLQRPVEQVSWNEAKNYCGKLTVRERAAGRLPAGYVYRLPTEAEWEYACRAGTATRFNYGDDPDYTSLGDYAWYSGNSGSQTHPVGKKLPNSWGLYDMHGNVWEWCQDWYGSSLPGGSVTDPRGPNTGSDRVHRGGCWSFSGRGCRTALRGRYNPGNRYRTLGFRPALASGQ